jgi:hypothetical protein
MTLVSCKKDDDKSTDAVVNSGTLKINDDSFVIVNAVAEYWGLNSGNTHYSYKIGLHTANLTGQQVLDGANVAESQYVTLNLNSPTASLQSGDYQYSSSNGGGPGDFVDAYYFDASNPNDLSFGYLGFGANNRASVVVTGNIYEFDYSFVDGAGNTISGTYVGTLVFLDQTI